MPCKGNRKYSVCFYCSHNHRYLEEELHNLIDPLEIAIVAYALYLTNSETKNTAFAALDRIKRYESE